MKSLIFALALSLQSIALAQSPVIYQDGAFLSGTELLTKFNNDFPNTSRWTQIAVPYDYKIPLLRKTKIAYRLSPNFSKDKPTVIFFNGGPGGHSVFKNFSDFLPHINIIYFNQRGASFSRPDNEKSFLDPNFYSSENTARDALEIVKSLNLQEVTVYGHSYGTVPATLFAHLFPDYTRTVILEGTVLNGEATLWNAPHRLRLVQQVFDQFPTPVQNEIIRLSQLPQANPSWFYNMVVKMMYFNDFAPQLKERVLSIYNSMNKGELKDADVLELAGANLVNIPEQIKNSLLEDDEFSQVLHFMISCKELSGDAADSSTQALFVGRKLFVTPNTQNKCELLKISKQNQIPFNSANFPIAKPVYYFQGVVDGATPAYLAIQHYKHVPQNAATLILIKKGGHSPVLSILSESEEPLFDEQKNYLAGIRNLFSKAVLGKTVTADDLVRLNFEDPQNWSFTSKK